MVRTHAQVAHPVRLGELLLHYGDQLQELNDQVQALRARVQALEERTRRGAATCPPLVTLAPPRCVPGSVGMPGS